jgi:type III pantothenate kinase
MLLAVDTGNTDSVFGIWHEDRWLHVFRISSKKQETATFYESRLRLFFLESNLAVNAIKTIVLSSVVPTLTPTVYNMLADFFQLKPLLVKHDVFPEIKINIENPQEIGSDLLANAVAAFVKYQRNCVIVDFGTALTFTTVSATGEILGVAIAPGLKTAVKSLFSNTAQLPEVPLKLPKSALGKNTTHAIQAGILLGYESMVKGMISRIRMELGGDCIAVATGGLSSIIDTLKEEFVEINRNLTLDGLRIIGEQAS